MKRYLRLGVYTATVLLCLTTTLQARKLKVYSVPKQLAPGQVGIIVFENPEPEKVRAQAKCGPERLIGWTPSDVPILRIEQNGKQMWMGLESYQTQGDSIIGTFMAPLTLETGRAQLFVVNEHDPSVPRGFDIVATVEPKLKMIEGNGITPLSQFRVIGDGFVAVELQDTKPAIDELEANVGYSKLTKADQWRNLNHKMEVVWYPVKQGDFLQMEQGGKTWPLFVTQCSFTPQGLALDFVAPPDVKPGSATLKLTVKVAGKELGTSAPLTVTVL